MIYNYTRCESVIAKIMADLDSLEVQLRTSDIKEWIFEAVDKIGAPMQYIRRESGADGLPILKIEDNQVPLPSDLVVLDGVAYSESEKGPWVPMNVNTSIFREPIKRNKPVVINGTPPHSENNRVIKELPDVVIEEIPPMMHKAITSQSQLYTNLGNKHADAYLHRYNNPEYFIKPGWIVTNKSKGFIKIAYKAMPTDERGYPLIPDLSSYQEAIYWYVTMKLSFPKWLNGSLGGNSKYSQKYAANSYSFIQQQWNFYRNQAYAEAMMPTSDDMENIKNGWNKLIPEWNSRDTFFKDIGKEQSIYTDYYYGY